MSAKDFPTGELTYFNAAARSLSLTGVDLASVRGKGGSARDYYDLVLREEAQLRQARPLPMPPRPQLPMPRRALPMPSGA